jgi:hypothetical protein
MKAAKIWKFLSVLYIIYYVCSLVLLLLIVVNKVPFTMMAVEWWQTLFLPIVAPRVFFFTSVEVLEPVPMLIWGVLAALGLFVLYKAVRYLLL